MYYVAMQMKSLIFIIREETPIFAPQEGYRRLWESPPIQSERYERRPCLYRVWCTCLSRIVLLFVKNGFVVGVRSLNVTAGH